MPKKSVSVTKSFTLETFMKQTTTLKISTNVIEDFVQALNDLVVKLTRVSEASAIKEERKTIMPPDLEQALEEILERRPLTVDELLQKIEPLSIIELSALAKKIKQKADDLLKPATFSRTKRKK